MNLTDVGRELRYPLTDMAILFAMIFYWLLFGLAQNARLLGVVGLLAGVASTVDAGLRTFWKHALILSQRWNSSNT